MVAPSVSACPDQSCVAAGLWVHDRIEKVVIFQQVKVAWPPSLRLVGLLARRPTQKGPPDLFPFCYPPRTRRLKAINLVAGAIRDNAKGGRAVCFEGGDRPWSVGMNVTPSYKKGSTWFGPGPNLLALRCTGSASP